MFKKALIGAVALALSANAANAGENKFTKEEGTGMFTGAAAGALVGGPIGAVVGLFVGGILGDSVGTANRADQRAQVLEDELLETRTALSQASQKVGEDQILNALTERLQGDVMFRTGSSELDEKVITKLAAIGKVLAEHANLEVQLHGFADPRGNSEENLKLSALRAEAVREALISGGADPAQIALSAHGEDLTTAAKDDVEAYAWERRVSLAIRPLGDASVAQSR
ncbi:MAG TPA: OmpA family protein [Steroidobacteraceae bacterium]|nr:OmpA family protein [Steroidobacteraceae bacterium]